MNVAVAAILKTNADQVVPLTNVSATGRLEGLLLDLTVSQHYTNSSDQNVEAVFTFPLPFHAVLLGFEMEINGQRHMAVATARRQATETYERAVEGGDTAALIENDSDGLYTVSVGNLLAGESACIRYRYAELLSAHEGQVRLQIPTAIAPRYGNPADARLEGPTIPATKLLAEYPFAISLTLSGITNTDGVRSPSHSITITAIEGGLNVNLARQGFLDRDFVLSLEEAVIPRETLIAPDGEGYAALASILLPAARDAARPVALKILLDCSGSMAGDSIAAAKRAVIRILEALNERDTVSLSRFGNESQQVSEGLEPADEHTVGPLKALVRRIEADLGGTEMAAALNQCLAIPVPAGQSADLILITDGEIYDVERVVNLAAHSGNRLFVIAIGVAPVEALARRLTEKTGGACEFVTAGEDPEEAILRTFKRLRSAPGALDSVAWPVVPTWTTPLPSYVFAGDTLHLFAGFSTPPDGPTTITVRDGAGAETALSIPVSHRIISGDLIPRIATALRLVTMEATEAEALAIKYQLSTKVTSFVVVIERATDEKANNLPATIPVPHMLTAGWGATARVDQRLSMDLMMAPLACRSFEVDDSEISRDSLEFPVRTADFAMAPLETSDNYVEVKFPESERTALLRSLIAATAAGMPVPLTLSQLVAGHPIPDSVRNALAELIQEDYQNDEAAVISAFLAILIESTVFPDVDTSILAVISRTYEGEHAYPFLHEQIGWSIFS